MFHTLFGRRDFIENMTMIFQVKVKVIEPRKVYTMDFSGAQEKYLYILFLDTFKRDILTLHENFPSLICKIGPVMEQ